MFWSFHILFSYVFLLFIFRMDWPELLNHSFWTPVLMDGEEKEDEGQAEGEEGEEEGDPANIYCSEEVGQTRISDPLYQVQTDEQLNSQLAFTQPAHRKSEKLISSQMVTATSGRQTDGQQVVRHSTCGASQNHHVLDRTLGKERRVEGQAKVKDDPKLTGVQQTCYTLQPHKSFTRGNTFTGVYFLFILSYK